MLIASAHVVAYSPTGTTARNLAEIAEGMGFPSPETTNLTLPAPSAPIRIPRTTITLIGAPVYAGRVAPEAVKRLSALSGDETPAVVVAVYGNRAYDNALMELADLAEKAGFKVVGAATLLGEHSFTRKDKPIAENRPDAKDLAAARAFGLDIRRKLDTLSTPDAQPALALPGSVPEEPFAGLSGMAPEVDASVCTGCGTCVRNCPTGAMKIEDGTATPDPAICTYCCACVKGCPEGGISITTPKILEVADRLHATCQERREPEFFL